ncbi:MAG: isochorismatase family protein [Ethanoligenens sp.]
MYTIKQLADLVGVTPKALRVYEKKELLLPTYRSDAGYRLYDETSLHTLSKICMLKEYRFTLTEITELLHLPDESLNQRLGQQVGKMLKDEDSTQTIATNLSQSLNADSKKSKFALLVINMQNDFTYGCLGFSAAKTLVSSSAQFIDYAHAERIPVIFLNDCHEEDDKREFYVWGKHAVKGSQGAEICSDFKTDDRDYFINKNFYSGFFNTNLLELLNRLQVTHLLVLGLDSNICIYHTIADAFNYGFKTTLFTDLTAAEYKTDYHSSISFMQGNFKTDMKDSTKAELF